MKVFNAYFKFTTDDAGHDTKAALTELISSYNHGNYSTLVDLNFIQDRFKCCGASDEADYTRLLPQSCCPGSFASAAHLCQRSQAYAHGCYSVISRTEAALLVNLVFVSTFLVTAAAATLALAYKLRQISMQLRAELHTQS